VLYFFIQERVVKYRNKGLTIAQKIDNIIYIMTNKSICFCVFIYKKIKHLVIVKIIYEGGYILAKEVLEKIKKAESESDRIIADANEKAKDILKNIEQKIKDDRDKIISEASIEAENLKNQSIEDAEKKVNSLLNSEEEDVNRILNIDEKRIDEVVNLLAERIVK